MNVTHPKILIVDDNPEIHSDFRKVLGAEIAEPALESLEASLFGDAPAAKISYTLDFASQGAAAVEMVRAAVGKGDPYGLAFVDVRMPPGMDGISTIAAIRKIDCKLDCVIVTAYSDCTPESARQKIGISEGLLFISKPFDPQIIRQLARKMLDHHAQMAAGR